VATDLDAGMAQFVSHFAESNDPQYAPPVPKCETRVCFLSNNFKVPINIGELKKVRHILLFLAKIKRNLFFFERNI